MQPNTTADKLANDLLTGILDKMNANTIEEAVPRIEPMVPEDYREVASKFPIKETLPFFNRSYSFTVNDVRTMKNKIPHWFLSLCFLRQTVDYRI